MALRRLPSQHGEVSVMISQLLTIFTNISAIPLFNKIQIQNFQLTNRIWYHLRSWLNISCAYQSCTPVKKNTQFYYITGPPHTPSIVFLVRAFCLPHYCEMCFPYTFCSLWEWNIKSIKLTNWMTKIVRALYQLEFAILVWIPMSILNILYILMQDNYWKSAVDLFWLVNIFI